MTDFHNPMANHPLLPSLRLGTATVMISLLTACASYNDGSLDYQHAKASKPLVLPANAQDATFMEVMDIPNITPTKPVKAAIVSNSKGKQYVLPAPAAVDTTRFKTPTLAIGAPSQPILTTDGNGYAVLQVEGDSNQVWERLNQAIKDANINATDRNQSLGKIDILYSAKPLQVRTHLVKLSTSITIQDTADTLSDKATTQALLMLILKHWPA